MYIKAGAGEYMDRLEVYMSAGTYGQARGVDVGWDIWAG